MNVGNLFVNAATSYPEQLAFIYNDHGRTYKESLRRIYGLSRALDTLGLRSGERVAIYMQNCPEYLETMFAVWLNGGVVVPLNVAFTPAELAWHMEDSGSVVLVTDADVSETTASTQHLPPHTVILVSNGPTDDKTSTLSLDDLIRDGGGEPRVVAAVDPDDLAWLAYTSGTTGRPKGAMLSHRSLVFQAVSALADCERLRRAHVGMHAAPLSHGSGYNALAYTMMACTQVIHRGRGFDVDLFLHQVEKYHVASVFLVPTQIKMIVGNPSLCRHDLSSLRWVLYGGAPMYRADQLKALKALGPVLVQIFGQTESPMSGTVLTREEHTLDDTDPRALSTGRVRHGLELRIVDGDGQELSPGKVGEICIRGATVMNGYWKRPEESAQTIVDGWLHTGDIGKMDDRGYLFILDRSNDVIISGGLNIYPREIEDVLMTHPAVREVCVVGVPDDKWGEAVRAVVVMQPDSRLEADELIAFTANKLAGFKKPKGIDFVSSLPKTTYNKTAKREVRAAYWAHLDRAI